MQTTDEDGSAVKAHQSARPWSIRAHLIVYGLVLLVPILTFAGLVLFRFALAEQTRFREDAQRVVRTAAAAIDQELSTFVAALDALATSPLLQTGDLAAFHAQARRALRVEDTQIALRDREGRQVLNTRTPWGTPLPTAVSRDADAVVLATGRPYVSDLVTSTVVRRPIVIVSVPVRRGDEIAYTLGLSLPPSRLRHLLTQEGLRTGWAVGLVDRRAVFLARTRDQERFIGERAGDDILKLGDGLEGAVERTNAEGTRVLFAYARVAQTGWIVGLGIPWDAYRAPLRRALWIGSALGAATLALSIALAAGFGRRISRPIRALSITAARLGEGEIAGPMQSELAEANAVARTLSAASIGLRERAAALAASEARFRALFEQAAVGIKQAELETDRIIAANPALCALLGYSRDELLTRTFADFTHPEDALVERPLLEALRRGERGSYAVEKRYVRRDGTARWVRITASVVEAGGPRTRLSIVEDIDERRRTEEALGVSEERFRLATEAFEGGVFDYDIARDRAVRTKRHSDIIGETPLTLASSREAWNGRIHPEDKPALEAERAEVLAGRQPSYEAEYRIRHRDGHWVWIWHRGLAMRDAGGVPRRIVGVVVDITERKRAEEHLRLLINELNHRVKNTLATVQSIASHTLRSDRPIAEARDAFEARLLALAKAHDVLTRENWDGASLRDIVAEAVAPYRDNRSGRFRIEGPPVRVEPRQALALAMALHELATNAAKYGALSREGGQVAIRWSLVAEPPSGVRLEWREEGGPPVAPPTRRGFGSRLIERSLAADLGGEATLDYAPTGLVCTVSWCLNT
ncbi:MAG TPA: PAS domain S-box protein [Beijerinckiaceae bacterium]